MAYLRLAWEKAGEVVNITSQFSAIALAKVYSMVFSVTLS